MRQVLALAPLLLALGACGGGPNLEDVADACSTSDGRLATADGGKTLLVSNVDFVDAGAPSAGARAATAAGACVLDELNVSASTRAKIGETSDMDGVKSEEIDGGTLSWSYSVDDGLALIVEAD